MNEGSKTDYAAMVRQDWEDLDYPMIDWCKKNLPEYFRQQGIKVPDNPVQEKTFMDRFLQMHFGHCEGLPDRHKVAAVLKGFGDDDISRVCKVIMPVNLRELWEESSYGFRKLETARQTRKELNTTIKKLSSHVKKCDESNYYPLIALEPMKEALAIATAYRDFLDSELNKSRFKHDGTEYKNLTSRDEWNPIISNVVDIVKETIKQSYKIEDIRCFSLTAKLLAAIYPWCWGKLSHKNATQIVRERDYRNRNT